MTVHTDQHSTSACIDNQGFIRPINRVW